MKEVHESSFILLKRSEKKTGNCEIFFCRRLKLSVGVKILAVEEKLNDLRNRYKMK